MVKKARKYKFPAAGDPVYLVITANDGGSETLNIRYYGSIIRRGEFLLCQCKDEREFRIPMIRMGGQRTIGSYWALAYSMKDAAALAEVMMAILHRRLKPSAPAAEEKYAG